MKNANKKARLCRAALSLSGLYLHVMGVRNNPRLHFDREPEAVYAEGYDGEEKPLDVVTEELYTLAVKAKLAAVDDRVLRIPSLLEAYCPRGSNPKRKNADKPLKNTNAYHSEKSAGEF